MFLWYVALKEESRVQYKNTYSLAEFQKHELAHLVGCSELIQLILDCREEKPRTEIYVVTAQQLRVRDIFK